MSTSWPVDELIANARATLLRDGAVHDGFTADDVRADDGDLLVVFTWRHDPKRYAVRLPLPTDPPESPWTGELVESVQEWAGDVHGLLCEELGTGLIRRAHRAHRGGMVELAYPAPWIDGTPDFYLSGVPLYSGTGAWLAEAGLDVCAPLRAYAEQRLICWVQAYLNQPPETTLGHAALSWDADRARAARLDVLQLGADVPETVARALAQLALHEAAESGATCVLTNQHHPTLPGLGFRGAGRENELVCDVTNLAPLSLIDWQFPP